MSHKKLNFRRQQLNTSRKSPNAFEALNKHSERQDSTIKGFLGDPSLAEATTFEQQVTKANKWAKHLFDNHVEGQMSRDGAWSCKINPNRNKFDYLKLLLSNKR